VHGHSNVPGATIFPHNIGLGAAHDPDLIRRIGAATAVEVAATGIEWTFAPTLAVPQDGRWGRAYEGYSSDPELVSSYAGPMTLGVQGELVAGKPIVAGHIAATAKHFLADGGTKDGKDQGDAQISEADRRWRTDGDGVLLKLERRQASRQQEPADRCSEGQDGLCRPLGRRLERTRPDPRLQHDQLPAGDQCRAGHVYGAG
jgi:hypothetical protein